MDDVDGNEVLGRVLSDARVVAVCRYAKSVGLPCSTDKEIREAGEAYYSLPYNERRKWQVRPSKFSVTLVRESLKCDSTENDNTAKAVLAYMKSGDAGHAMRVAGMPYNVPWTEQKRNAAGVVEILEADLFGPEGASSSSILESLEEEARNSGLYDDLDVISDEEEEEPSVGADEVLARARELVPAHWLAMFLLVEVDGHSRRKVAEEFKVSTRAVWQAVENTKAVLRRADYSNSASVEK